MTDFYDEDKMEEEREYAVFKETMSEQQKHLSRFQREQQEQANQKFQGDVFGEGLREAGVDPEVFQNLVNEDPAHAQKMFSHGVKTYIKAVANKPRDSKGRYVKGTEQPQEQPLADRAERLAKSHQEKRKPFDPKTSEGTDRDIKNMVLDRLGDDPMFD
jgi:hypothetical protein